MWMGNNWRMKIVQSVIDGVRIFKKGVPTKEGKEFADLLESDKVDLIGFVPDVTYIRATSRDPSDLEVLWNHKFSIPTLLYHLKGTPFLLLVNPNVAYNDSKLLEIKENADLIEIRDLKGIIG
jgi:hypothetical protein